MGMVTLRYAWWREGLFDLELAGAATVAGDWRERVGWWFGGGWGCVGGL